MKFLHPLMLYRAISHLIKNNFHHVSKIHARKVLLQKQNENCFMCNDAFSTTVPHELHHVDHNKKNNTLENLVMLCCNCHASIHRYNASFPLEELDSLHEERFF